MPRRHYPYQRLSVLCGQMKGKMWFWRKEKKKWGKEEKKCKKPLKCKGTEKSSESKCWWNRAITDQTKSLFHLIIHHIWRTAHWDEKVEDLLSENEVLGPSLYIFSARNEQKKGSGIRVDKKKKRGMGGGGFREWWGRWRGWKMCCWRRQHPRCQSKQGWAEGPQVCSLPAWLQTGCSTDSPKRLPLHTIQPCALQDSLSLSVSLSLSLSLSVSLSVVLADWPPVSTWIAKSEGEKNKMANLCFEVPHIDNDTLQHREKMWGAFFYWHWNVLYVMSVLYHLVPNSEIGHNMLSSSLTLWLQSFQCLIFVPWSSTMISLPLSFFSHYFPASLPPPPSEDKLWLGPDIPSNLLSQHRVKRARVLRRKPLYATTAVPEETWHTTAQGCHAGNLFSFKKNKSINEMCTVC